MMNNVISHIKIFSPVRRIGNLSKSVSFEADGGSCPPFSLTFIPLKSALKREKGFPAIAVRTENSSNYLLAELVVTKKAPIWAATLDALISSNYDNKDNQ